MPAPLPFDDSRRLQGANLFFAGPGAVLDVAGSLADESLVTAWRERVQQARRHLGWPDAPTVARRHARGTSLALAAPVDQLFVATEVNEWALCASLRTRDPARWSGLEGAWRTAALEANAGTANPAADDPPQIEAAAALARLAALAAREARPALRQLLCAAAERRLPTVLDEELLTLGAGTGSHSWPLAALPAASAVDWTALHDVPTALVTGSNGKTTTVRLLAACARAAGLTAAFNCTDGVFVDGSLIEAGDYSGPAGARRVLRDPRTGAAILETARGGILRRGIAASRAQAAVVTNISADHFGEYGIDDLAGLADAKLSVGGVVSTEGLLVLNAADPALRAGATRLTARFGQTPPLGWFAAADEDPHLRALREAGAPTCGVEAGHLRLRHDGSDHDLGHVGEMPLSLQGSAAYNIGNLAAAALAAAALGIAAPTIAAVFRRFGAQNADNPGRLMRFRRDGITVLVDYAHNPDGLRGFLAVANHLRAPPGRLGLVLGHAGNRLDSDIEALARVAAGFRPDLIVIKENDAQLRGRAPGEVPRILRAELDRCGVSPESLPFTAPSELEAVRYALGWARAGDVLALPVHGAAARAAVLAELGAG